MTVQEAIKYLRMATDEADEYSDMYVEMCNMSIKALEEVEQYRALGTVEELKEAREKQMAKKPRFYAHNYYCTECGNLVGNNEFKWQRFLCCDKCGQALKWEEEDV